MDTSEQKLFGQLHALIVRELESTATEAGHAELETLLLENSAARRLYIQYFQETACLRWLCVEEMASRDDATPSTLPLAERDRSRQQRRRLVGLLATIACSLLLVSLFNVVGRDSSRPELAHSIGTSPNNQEQPRRAASGPNSVATVTALDSVRWSEAAEGSRLLARCQIGQRLKLAEGRAEFTFDAGVLVTVFAPADFEIISSNSIRCHSGRVMALVDDRGKGFTIETPDGKVVDLGTQFGLDVSNDGGTQVVVFQGTVDVTYGSGSSLPNGGQRRRLERGDGLLFKSSGELQRLMAVRRDKFLQSAERASNRPSIIADVRDNIRKNESVKSYQIVHGGLLEDVLCFVDRDHEWNGIDESGIPGFLVGADYIMPFNDDKFVQELELEVYIVRPALLYIFLDNNMEVPAWLREGFTDTGFDIGLDGATTDWHPANALGTGAGQSVDFTFSVWRREITRPGAVRLGGVTPPRRRPLGFNMYGIAAVAGDFAAN